MIQREQQREMITRAKHVTPRSSKVQDTKNQTEAFNSFNLCSNPFVNPVSNNVNAHATPLDIKMQLRDIYQPDALENNQAFEELCKIAFGRLKQYMHSHRVPYSQLELWKISSLITFSVVLLNGFFIKLPYQTVSILTLHLIEIIPLGLIAKRMDNKERDVLINKLIEKRYGEKGDSLS